MNVQLSSVYPLPRILNNAQEAGPHRRQHIGEFTLSPAVLARFNRLLAALGRAEQPLDRDQVATAARELIDHAPEPVIPQCILARMHQARAVSLMLTDADWRIASPVQAPVQAVHEYLRGQDHLIPDSLPQVAHLDDALVIDTAWPLIEVEVASYADFRRMRRLHAWQRGCAEEALAFDRAAWERMHNGEAAWLAHRRQVRESRYAPATPDCFRVH